MSTNAEFIAGLPPAPEPGTALPHDGRFDDGDVAALKAKGYAPEDVRFMDGAEAVRATLRGVRMRTVKLTKELAEALKLEADINGMRNSKTREQKVTKITPDVMETLAAFGAPSEEHSQVASLPKIKGRGPDKAPRRKRDPLNQEISEIVSSELRPK